MQPPFSAIDSPDGTIFFGEINPLYKKHTQMYTNNEGPRSSQEDIRNIDLESSTTTQTSQDSERQDTRLSDQGSDKDALTTRTPERWWLRKRLMQG
jgi:hypothetical protein